MKLNSRSSLLLALALSSAMACGPSVTPVTDSSTDGSAMDAAASDVVSRPDGAAPDAAERDAATNDTGAADASTANDGSASDAATADATTSDAATADASASDATGTDVTASDTSASRDATTDGSISDASSMDASSMDASGSDGSAGDAALTCSILGDWTTNVMGGTLGFRFTAMNTVLAAPSAAALEGGTLFNIGDYATPSGTIVITNDRSGVSGCAATDRGEYRIAYNPTCGTMTWTVVSDTCTARGASLNGATFVRYVPRADGGVPDGSAADASAGDAGSCRMDGDWSAVFAGPGMMMAFFRFNMLGTWEAALSAAQLTAGPRIALGNQAEAAARIVLTNDASGASGCAVTDRGEYTIVYSGGCRTAVWSVVSDTCTTRAMALNGGTFTRL